MPCYLTDAGTGFICGELGAHCVCGRAADYLCDYPVGDGKTCDRSLCKHCAQRIGPDVDYCTPHATEWRKFVDSGGAADALHNVRSFPR